MGENNEKIEKDFLTASENIKKSKKKLENETLLKLYGYYKQGSIGDCNIPSPLFWQLKEKAKWDAWELNKGIRKNSAMKKYIKLVTEILES